MNLEGWLLFISSGYFLLCVDYTPIKKPSSRALREDRVTYDYYFFSSCLLLTELSRFGSLNGLLLSFQLTNQWQHFGTEVLNLFDKM